MASKVTPPAKPVTPPTRPATLAEARMPSAGAPLTPVDPHTPFEDGFAATDEAIRQLAYRRWEEAGSPEGDGAEFWLQAEQELKTGATE